MRLRRTAAAAAVAVLALAACSGGEGQRADTVEPRDTASPTPATATPAGPKQATAAQVKAALLDVGELPTGWSVDTDDDDDDDDFSEGCPELAALDDTFEDEDNPDAEIAFSKDDFGPFLGEGVASLASAERVSEGIAAMKKAFDACPRFSYRDEEGKKQTVEIAPVSFAKLGDQTLAARLSLSFEGGTARVTIVVVRVRNHVLMLTGMGITTVFGGGRLEATELEEIARAAVEKVDTTLP